LLTSWIPQKLRSDLILSDLIEDGPRFRGWVARGGDGPADDDVAGAGGDGLGGGDDPAQEVILI
jgi:hypothetical protein